MSDYTAEDFEDAAQAMPAGVERYCIIRNGQSVDRAFYFQDMFEYAAQLKRENDLLKRAAGVSPAPGGEQP